MIQNGLTKITVAIFHQVLNDIFLPFTICSMQGSTEHSKSHNDYYKYNVRAYIRLNFKQV